MARKINNLDSNYLDTSIRWVDKLTLCANGDIIEDFSGKVVGHITPNVYKEITKNETLSIGLKKEAENDSISKISDDSEH